MLELNTVLSAPLNAQKTHINSPSPGATLASIAGVIANTDKSVVVIVKNTNEVSRICAELDFYLQDNQVELIKFPDWETLPYDTFSPHQDIISDRLTALNILGREKRQVLIVSLNSMVQKICPLSYIKTSTFILKVGDILDTEALKSELTQIGYQHTNQVIEHGEFAIRGSIIDIFPSGSDTPFRLDLFDDEIETIRIFCPDTQISSGKQNNITILPAREFPLDEAGVSKFRSNWRDNFPGNPSQVDVYTDVSTGNIPAGIEYYLPLFFDTTGVITDYIAADSLVIYDAEIIKLVDSFWDEVKHRYEQLRHDISKPLLAPKMLYQPSQDFWQNLKSYQQLVFTQNRVAPASKILSLPDLSAAIKEQNAFTKLHEFLSSFSGKVLFVTESLGRKEALRVLLGNENITVTELNSWHDFPAVKTKYAITVGAVNSGWQCPTNQVAIIPESALFGNRVSQQRRRRKNPTQDTAIRSIAELITGDLVVHYDYGIGRYLGLKQISFNNIQDEFVTIEYAGGDKIHVPVSNLSLISVYTGSENTNLSRIGSDKWHKDKKRVAAKIRDVAAELLEVYAKRAAKKGISFELPEPEYSKFVNGFPFEETPDQQEAISCVVADLCKEQAMDRVVCGDVGFGKTEVAMRAAFIVASNSKQTVVLVPTTLLAEQHYHTFTDRFAETGVTVEVLSRFKSNQQQAIILDKLAAGKIDILIATHKLIMQPPRLRDLGLLVIDEEHRFGVRQKEKLKAYKSEVDVLTLTATPIPRTLNAAMLGIRDLSIIATPPLKRLAIKTFVREHSIPLVLEAITRELRRGGQVYYLHNDVKTITKAADILSEKLPDAKIAIAHGQMRESLLENVMSEFYHGKHNILVCTTIIETGIDIPAANTIIIARADKLGLAQLHQLRGRVGRSHHQAYAYCLTPKKDAMTQDAVKRLTALEAFDHLGAGFSLATQDLEIRGAGELLGDEQSGEIAAIGLTMYMDLLNSTVQALQDDSIPANYQPNSHCDVDLGINALIPSDYIGDVQLRLLLYKRIAHAKSHDELGELKIEMIDRFGILPEPLKNLFQQTLLRLQCTHLGINKLKIGSKGGKISFNSKTNFSPNCLIAMMQKQPMVYKLVGSEVLQIKNAMPEPKDRFDFVSNLLNNLQVNPAEAV